MTAEQGAVWSSLVLHRTQSGLTGGPAAPHTPLPHSAAAGEAPQPSPAATSSSLQGPPPHTAHLEGDVLLQLSQQPEWLHQQLQDGCQGEGDHAQRVT